MTVDEQKKKTSGEDEPRRTMNGKTEVEDDGEQCTALKIINVSRSLTDN